MMPTHVLSHHRASPFLDDVIINQAVEKNARPGAIFKYSDMCFHPDSRQRGGVDILLSEESGCHAFKTSTGDK